MAYTLVLLRHGESTWNRDNLFTGWMDVPLTEKGEEEAKEAGRQLAKNGYSFDIVYTSLLKRAHDTTRIVFQEMGVSGIPEISDWRLNERHYGALQGLNKKETAEKYGFDQMKIWRRSFDVPPPALTPGDPRCPHADPLYAGIPESQLPLSESLKDVIARVVPYWESRIAPDIRAGKKVLISAHGNSLRALVKFLDGMSDEDIVEYNIPTGIPLVYELDENLTPLRKFYLADEDRLKEAVDKVANQGK